MFFGWGVRRKEITDFTDITAREGTGSKRHAIFDCAVYQ